MKLRLAAPLAAWIAVGAVVTIAQAGTTLPAQQSAGDARAHGRFVMSGVITDAINVRGERPGERVRRTWMIHPTGCSGSACRRLQIIRNRGAVQRSYVVLRRVGPGVYQGSGVFWVGLECLGHRYRLGSRVPYVITLRVTSRRRIGSLWYATALQASYSNTARSDGTRCPLGAASDAASYSGRLASRLPKPPRRKRRPRPRPRPRPPAPTTTTTTTTTIPTVTETITTGTTTVPTPTQTQTVTTTPVSRAWRARRRDVGPAAPGVRRRA